MAIEKRRTEQERAEAAFRSVEHELQRQAHILKYREEAYSKMLSALSRKIVSLAKDETEMHVNTLRPFNTEISAAAINARYEASSLEQYALTSQHSPLTALISKELDDVVVSTEADNMLTDHVVERYIQVYEADIAYRVEREASVVEVGRMRNGTTITVAQLDKVADTLNEWMKADRQKATEADYGYLATELCRVLDLFHDAGEYDFSQLLGIIEVLKKDTSKLLAPMATEVQLDFLYQALLQIPIAEVNLTTSAQIASDLARQLNTCIKSGNADLVEAGIIRIEQMLWRLENSIGKVSKQALYDLEHSMDYELLLDVMINEIIAPLSDYYEPQGIRDRLLRQVIWTDQYNNLKKAREDREEKIEKIENFTAMIAERSSRTSDVESLRRKFKDVRASGEAQQLPDLDEKLLFFNSRLSGIAINLVELCKETGLGTSGNEGGNLNPNNLKRLVRIRTSMEDALWAIAGGDFQSQLLARSIEYLELLLESINNIFNKKVYNSTHDEPHFFNSVWRGVVSSFWARAYYQEQGFEIVPFANSEVAFVFDQNKKVDLIIRATQPDANGEFPMYYVQVKSATKERHSYDAVAGDNADDVIVTLPGGRSQTMPESVFISTLRENHRSTFASLKSAAAEDNKKQSDGPIKWRFIYINPEDPQVV